VDGLVIGSRCGSNSVRGCSVELWLRRVDSVESGAIELGAVEEEDFGVEWRWRGLSGDRRAVSQKSRPRGHFMIVVA
jgi:hypothetical protein